jgi:Tfp pilus assembly protein PilO
MDRAERQKAILLALLIVLVGYFGWRGVGGVPGVSGLRAEAQKLERERTDLQQQVSNARVLLANLDRIRKEREALEIQLRDLARRLPTEHESAQVLRSVETLAGKSGLTVGEVRRRASRPQELYVEIPMDVGVGGSYQELLRFSAELAQLPRLVTLHEITVRARQAAATPGRAATAGRGTDLTPGAVRADLVAVVFQALSPGSDAAPAPSPQR